MVLLSGTLDLLSFLLFYSFTFLLLNSFFYLFTLKSPFYFSTFIHRVVCGFWWQSRGGMGLCWKPVFCVCEIHLPLARSNKKIGNLQKNTTVKGWEIKRKPYLCAEVRVLQKEDTINVETQIHSRSVKMPAIHELDSSNVRIILKLTYIIKIMDNVIVKLAHSSRVMTTSSYIK